jgi:hypothetical protein
VGEQNHPSLLAISFPNESKKALVFYYLISNFLTFTSLTSLESKGDCFSVFKFDNDGELLSGGSA